MGEEAFSKMESSIDHIDLVTEMTNNIFSEGVVPLGGQGGG